MENKSKNLSYPTRYEIKQTLTEFCSRRFVDRFAQSRGIFVSRATQEELATQLSRFYYENKDIEEIREKAYRKSSHRTLSGFIVSSLDDNFEPISTLEELRGSNNLSKRIEIGSIVQENLEGGAKVYKGELSYVDVKPGRTEFLQEETRHLDYVVKPISENTYQILVESNKSSDAKFFEDFIKRNAGKDIKLEILDLDLMSAQNTVNFFDDLAISGMLDDWRLTQVKHLVLRKGNEEEEEADTTVLSGITQAILDGSNLRENSFVKQSEDGGYRFTAMTFEFESKEHPFVIDVKAEFKLRPKVFEVSVHNYRQRVGTEEKLEKADLESNLEIEIKTHVWLKAKEIYKNLVSNSTSE